MEVSGYEKRSVLICTVQRLVKTLYRSIQLSVPEVKCALVNLQGFKVPKDADKVTQLAHFIRETLRLGACALSQLVTRVSMTLLELTV